MIETIYNTENDSLSILINSKAILQNISHKLANDKNSIEFFATLVSNIENYDSLERMEKYYFENDFRAMFKTLRLFYRGLQSDDYIKAVSSEKLIKCCNVFPDHIGERIVMQISHLPIMELLYEDLKYREFLEKLTSGDAGMGQTMKEYQEERLFSDGLLSVKFPDDDNFVDYDLRNRYVEKLKDEYEDSRKDEINIAIKILLDVYKSSEDLKATKLQIGATYWDEKISLTSKNADGFKDAIMALSSSFEKECEEKLKKLTMILKDEFENVITAKIDTIYMSKQKEADRVYYISISTEKELLDEEIASMLKVFVLKKDYECTDLLLDSNFDNKKLVFKCEVEV